MGIFHSKPFLLDSDEEEENVFCNRKRSGKPQASPGDSDLLRYSFVHQMICKEYLKCNIKPWRKKGESFGEDGKSISLETLPTDFFDKDYLEWRRKVGQHFTLEGEKYRRVVGYREIMIKREYAEYLEDLKITDERITSAIKINKSFPVYQYWRLARGGGPKKSVADVKSVKSVARKSVKGTASTTSVASAAATKEGGGGCFGNSGKKRPSNDKGGRKKAIKWNRNAVLKHQAVRKWKWPDNRKRLPTPYDPDGKYVVLLHRLYRMPNENEERDNEWLYLSSSTEDNDPNVFSHFEKEPHRWMTPGISYESQKLFRNLGLMWAIMLFSGRSFLHHRNNFYRGHIEFSARKSQMIFFFLTTILLWTILCISFCSYADINTHVNILHSRRNFFLLEKIELWKYWLPYALIMSNLILVSFWSLAVILGDGALIANYLNCWCAALHEIESSAALGIRKVTLANVQIFFLLVGAYAIMFVYDWPPQVRGSCMLTSMLLFRSSITLIRINQPGVVLMYQCIGLGIHIYILLCARLVMCFLQLFATMVKNVSELWNFKFALRYHLVAQQTRGELFEMQLNSSLAKLWSHHRLIVVLLQQYGLVFSVGIISYLILQLWIIVVALITFILADRHGLRKEFYGSETHIKIYSDGAPTIEIPYYHSEMEEAFMALCVFVHVCIDFLYTTETLTSATSAYMMGAEFVRRAGVMNSPKSHERRLIISLQWSFNPTRLHGLTANRFFTLDRPSLTRLLSFFILVFTIIIRLHHHMDPIKLYFPRPNSCSHELGQKLIHGLCVVENENVTVSMLPPPPPANYYFFMEHCEEIEKKHKDKVEFEYYSDNSRVADKPPFQICQVKIPNGTFLPPELIDIGRYFQDHGNSRLQETLKIYLDQTYDPTALDYSTMTASSVGNHPVSTGGTYCGPDLKGQSGQLCEWVEYYRDCVVVCYSNVLSKVLLIQKMWRRVNTGHYTLYTDYSKVDCGINPFGLKFKGGQWMVDEPAYNCFGEEVKLDKFDLCSNMLSKEPAGSFLPAVGDKKRLQRSYTSDWLVGEKSLVAAPLSLTHCDKCYDNRAGQDRCGDSSLVHNHCPYSRYWGEPGPTRGYYFVEKCFQLRIDALDVPKANGFCRWEYVEGGIIAGHVVSELDYNKARTTQWDKEWDIASGVLPPCQQTQFSPGALSPIHEHLYFKHVCLSQNNPHPGSCQLAPSPSNRTYFYAYRPYELIKNCTKLRQIRFDYEKPQGNSQLCNYTLGIMNVPDNGALNFTIRGNMESHHAFYGCHGKLLLPTTKAYHCISPSLAGVCEVDAESGFFLYGDCTDPEVLARKSVVAAVSNQTNSSHSQQKLDFGLCPALVDYAEPIFKDHQYKLLLEDLVQMLHNIMAWKAVNKWTTLNTVLSKHPGVPSLPSSQQLCDVRLSVNYCGENSVPLHYPFDGRDSAQAGDKFLCNWEVYYRECMQPFKSNISGGWVYLPKWTPATTKKMHPVQRKVDPLLNTFYGDKDMIGCDGRKLPTSGKSVDDYWKDECGWIMTPEFVDGDVKSLAVMAPILPIANKVYRKDDGQSMVDNVIHCYDSEYAIYRCTHPDIFPICKSNLSNWDPSHGVVDSCYRFNMSCYMEFNKAPNGSVDVPTYPEGFCRGYCPMVDTTREGALDESFMITWRNLSNLNFSLPPCLNKTTESQMLFLDFSTPREIERRLFFEFHCSDRTKNGLLRDAFGAFSSSFHRPMYRDNVTLDYKFIPLEPLLDHLTTNFGPSCSYNGSADQGKIYPKVVTWTDATTGETISVDQSEFLGCHGHPLVWFTEEFRRNPDQMREVGINDPLVDYPLACYGRLLAGWCEARVEHLVFMRDDFYVTCDGSKGSLPVKCPQTCLDMQGHFAKHPLASQIQDMPGYWPFVQSKRKYVLLRDKDTLSSHNSARTDLPYRRLLLSEFKEATMHWRMYKDPKLHRKYVAAVRKDKWDICFHSGNWSRAKEKCHFPKWLKRCVAPCVLVTPKIITENAQSLVDVTPGQGDMFLMNIPYSVYYRQVGGTAYEPKYSFMDCVIDPMTVIRNYSDWTLGLNTCYGTTIPGGDPGILDAWKWIRFPEYLPDFNNQQVDPVTGFVFVPWKIDYPKKVQFDYQLFENYNNPSLVYAANRSTVNKSVELYASPYLACHRMTQEPMRIAVLTALATYWNKTLARFFPVLGGKGGIVEFKLNEYSYDPEHAVPSLCKETAVSIYLDGDMCSKWGVPSNVLRIYGACTAIFPAINADSAFAALRENVQGSPPEGCVTNTSNYALFNKTWTSLSMRGYAGFGMKYSVPNMYDMWDSLCHSCAYTKEMHQDNLRKTWCGHEVNNRSACMSEFETGNRRLSDGKHLTSAMVVGEGIFFKHWSYGLTLPRIGYLYRLATHYFCWDKTYTRYVAFARWRTYHPWSLHHETEKPAAYLIHVPLNALNCLYPCKSHDESEDCNSLCPLELHNPCGRNPEEFFSFQSPTVGLNYTVVLKENDQLCNARLAGLGSTTQGLGMFGEYGFNIVRANENYMHLRSGTRIFSSSSELMFENGPWNNEKGHPSKKNTNMYVYRVTWSGNFFSIRRDWVAVNIPTAVTKIVEVPRMIAVHPGWHEANADKKPQYSSFCAGFEGDTCEVVSVDWDYSQKIPNGYNTFAEAVQRIWDLKPIDYMRLNFSYGCTAQDRKLVLDLLSSDPRGTYDKTYCCVPFQMERNSPKISSTEWEKRFFLSARNTWTDCEDRKDPKTNLSHFGWLFGFNKFARYLGACPFQDCTSTSCRLQLKDYKPNSETNLCTRQFDPEEKFLQTPLPNCKLPKPPF